MGISQFPLGTCLTLDFMLSGAHMEIEIRPLRQGIDEIDQVEITIRAPW